MSGSRHSGCGNRRRECARRCNLRAVATYGARTANFSRDVAASRPAARPAVCVALAACAVFPRVAGCSGSAVVAARVADYFGSAVAVHAAACPDFVVVAAARVVACSEFAAADSERAAACSGFVVVDSARVAGCSGSAGVVAARVAVAAASEVVAAWSVVLCFAFVVACPGFAAVAVRCQWKWLRKAVAAMLLLSCPFVSSRVTSRTAWTSNSQLTVLYGSVADFVPGSWQARTWSRCPQVLLPQNSACNSC